MASAAPARSWFDVVIEQPNQKEKEFNTTSLPQTSEEDTFDECARKVEARMKFVFQALLYDCALIAKKRSEQSIDAATSRAACDALNSLPLQLPTDDTLDGQLQSYSDLISEAYNKIDAKNPTNSGLAKFDAEFSADFTASEMALNPLYSYAKDKKFPITMLIVDTWINLDLYYVVDKLAKKVASTDASNIALVTSEASSKLFSINQYMILQLVAMILLIKTAKRLSGTELVKFVKDDLLNFITTYITPPRSTNFGEKAPASSDSPPELPNNQLDTKVLTWIMWSFFSLYCVLCSRCFFEVPPGKIDNFPPETTYDDYARALFLSSEPFVCYFALNDAYSFYESLRNKVTELEKKNKAQDVDISVPRSFRMLQTWFLPDSETYKFSVVVPLLVFDTQSKLDPAVVTTKSYEAIVSAYRGFVTPFLLVNYYQLWTPSFGVKPPEKQPQQNQRLIQSLKKLVLSFVLTPKEEFASAAPQAESEEPPQQVSLEKLGEVIYATTPILSLGETIILTSSVPVTTNILSRTPEIGWANVTSIIRQSSPCGPPLQQQLGEQPLETFSKKVFDLTCNYYIRLLQKEINISVTIPVNLNLIFTFSGSPTDLTRQIKEYNNDVQQSLNFLNKKLRRPVPPLTDEETLFLQRVSVFAPAPPAPPAPPQEVVQQEGPTQTGTTTIRPGSQGSTSSSSSSSSSSSTRSLKPSTISQTVQTIQTVQTAQTTQTEPTVQQTQMTQTAPTIITPEALLEQLRAARDANQINRIIEITSRIVQNVSKSLEERTNEIELLKVLRDFITAQEGVITEQQQQQQQTQQLQESKPDVDIVLVNVIGEPITGPQQPSPSNVPLGPGPSAEDLIPAQFVSPSDWDLTNLEQIIEQFGILKTKFEEAGQDFQKLAEEDERNIQAALEILSTNKGSIEAIAQKSVPTVREQIAEIYEYIGE